MPEDNPTLRARANRRLDLVLAIPAIPLLLYLLLPDSDTAAYCVAGSPLPTARVVPVEVPLCRGGVYAYDFTGRTSLDFRDVKAWLIRDDRKLYLMDHGQESSNMTEFRLDGATLRSSVEITGQAFEMPLPEGWGGIVDARYDGSPRFQLAHGKEVRAFEVVRENGSLKLLEYSSALALRDPPAGPLVPFYCEAVPVVRALPELSAVVVLGSHHFSITDERERFFSVSTVRRVEPGMAYGTRILDMTTSPAFRQDYGHLIDLRPIGRGGWYRVAGDEQEYVVRIVRNGEKFTFSRAIRWPLSFPGCLLAGIKGAADSLTSR